METNGKTSVLIIDDSTQKITMLESILGKLDINLVSVTSGTDGLRKLLVQEFACILLDVNMPVMDGFETAKMIRQRPQSQKTPIIFVTAVNSAEIDMRKGYHIGAVDYILTPLIPEILIAKVTVFVELFEKNRSLQKQAEELRENSLQLAEQANQLKQLNEELEEHVKERTAELIKSKEQYEFLSNQFEAILDHIPGMVFYKDTKNNFIRINKYLADLHHKTKEELENKSLFELYPQEDARKYFDEDLEVISSGKPKLGFDEPMETENGSRWVNTSKIPFEDKDGKIVGIIGISLDITDRRLAEEKLRESNDRFNRLVSDLNEIVWTAKYDGSQVIDVNHSFENVFGITVDELKANPKLWLEMVHPDDRQLARQSARELIRKGRAEAEYRIVRPDSSTVWLLDSKTLINNKNGKPVQIGGIATDITHRKQIEEERKLLAHAIASINECVCITDTNDIIQFVNDAFLATYNYSKDELIGKHINIVRPPDVATEITNKIVSDTFNGGWNGEIINQKKDGTLFPVYLSTSVIHDDRNRPVALIGVAIDITERKLAEEKLIESEERYKRITEGLTDYLYTVIVKDGKAVETIHSEACRAITGYTPSEFADDPNLWIHMVVPEEREFVEKRAGNILAGKAQPPIEHRIIRKDGETRWVMDTTIPKFDAEGRLGSYDGVIQDITKRKQAELLLREKNEEIETQNEKLNQTNTELIIAKEKAEESDRLKSAFLANMSHEIRTPMNGILGFTELLKEPDLTGEMQEYYINIIEKSGTRMLNIINDIINISKIESGQMGVSISETNINEQIEYIYTFFKPEVEQKGLQIFYRNTLPAKEAIIKTDHEKIYAILTNLVKNAIKFTKTGSIEFGYEKKGNHLQFFVTDTGIGIRPEQLKIVFERFRQGSESLNRNYEGAGLGLSISKAYVEMLGGKIWVESEPGKGSTFYFTLPYNTQTEGKIVSKNAELSDVEIKPVNKLKILIAEDDQGSEILLSLAVEKFSKNILKARTGIEAVETCRNNTDIDLVLMDLKMPEMDGYEATRHIRQFNKDLVIIAQTAFALSGDLEKAIEAGCNDYISKPIRKDKLMEVIQKHF